MSCRSICRCWLGDEIYESVGRSIDWAAVFTGKLAPTVDSYSKSGRPVGALRASATSLVTLVRLATGK
jgi:hypothetical protein